MKTKVNQTSVKAYGPPIGATELDAIIAAVKMGRFAGAGPIGRRVEKAMEEAFSVKHVLLTPSCTAALEMAMILLDIGPGDEVIMPSFTFVSCANCVVLRGGKPIFAEICDDTLNLDPEDVSNRITARTKVILPVHYGGVACDLTSLKALAAKHKLFLIEDAAQGVDARYNGEYLGTLGTIGCYSFHATKNIMCGEGGAFLTNDSNLARRAEILREKGTNRAEFLRSEVNKYSWVDVGSSYILSDLLAALLEPQLEQRTSIRAKRKLVYDSYNSDLLTLAEKGYVRLPIVPKECDINYHIYFLRTNTAEERNALLQHLQNSGVQASFHFVPLHDSPFGRSIDNYDPLPITEKSAATLVRLPIGTHISFEDAKFVADQVKQFFG